MMTQEEVLQYAIKMYRRGDSYYQIKKFLDRQVSDEQTVSNIITAVVEFEKQHAKPVREKKNIPVLNIVMGSIFIAGGLGLVFFLWERGFVATLPLIMVIIGITALARR